MRTVLFSVSGGMPFAVKLIGIALLVAIVFVLVFGTVTPIVNLVIAALVTLAKGAGVAALTAMPVALIKLGVL